MVRGRELLDEFEDVYEPFEGFWTSGGSEVGLDDLRALDRDEFARLLLKIGQVYECEGLKAGPELTLEAPCAARDAAHESRLLRHAEDDFVRVGQLISL